MLQIDQAVSGLSDLCRATKAEGIESKKRCDMQGRAVGVSCSSCCAAARLCDVLLMTRGDDKNKGPV